MIREEMMDVEGPIIGACIKSAGRNGWNGTTGVLRSSLLLGGDPVSLEPLAESRRLQQDGCPFQHEHSGILAEDSRGAELEV